MVTKKGLFGLLIALPILTVPLMAASSSAETPGPHCGMRHSMMGMRQGMLAFRDKAKFNVVNSETGVTLTVNSDDPEVAKQIQEHFANFGKFQQRGQEGQEGNAVPSSDK